MRQLVLIVHPQRLCRSLNEHMVDLLVLLLNAVLEWGRNASAVW